MQIRITGGRLVDPGHFDGIADIHIEAGKIVAIIENGQTGEQDRASNIQQPGTRIFDASGKIVTPGLIDMHVHFISPMSAQRVPCGPSGMPKPEASG